MKFGLFNNEIKIKDIRENFEFIGKTGCSTVQFDFIDLLGDSVPEEITENMIYEINEASKWSGITICAVSGTYNMIHPDREYRLLYRKRLPTFYRTCREIGAGIVTLCTGTRNLEFMWKYSPENTTESAWNDIVEETSFCADLAKNEGLVLGIECEAANVIFNPERAKKLIGAVGRDNVKVVLDGANLFENGEVTPDRSRNNLKRAFSLLSGDIVMAHGKDIKAGTGLNFCPAGQGAVDFRYMMENLYSIGFDGPMIAHGIRKPEDFKPSVDYLRQIYAEVSGK